MRWRHEHACQPFAQNRHEPGHNAEHDNELQKIVKHLSSSHPVEGNDERRRKYEEAERRRHEYQVVHKFTEIRED
jgi:hypothetical protein